MTRQMFDGIAADAPAIAALRMPIGLVAGYDDGRYAWGAAQWALFPDSVHVHIVVSPSTDSGTVGDGPPDNGTWPEWVAWVVRRRAAGVDPTMYTDGALWAAGRAAFAAAGVAEPHWWVAEYVNDPSMPPAAVPARAVALQWYDFGQYDASLVADYWPGVDPPPPGPASGPVSTMEDDMTTYYPIQVLPDPAGAANACGVCSWPAGPAGAPGVPHVLQLMADPGFWGAAEGSFRLVFSMLTGPDVETVKITKPGESTAVELATVPGYNPQACRGVTITRPDGARWPWGGGAQ